MDRLSKTNNLKKILNEEDLIDKKFILITFIGHLKQKLKDQKTPNLYQKLKAYKTY